MTKNIRAILFLAAVLITCSSTSFAQSTVVWIMRHAEKDVSNPQNPDPDLSAEGVKRGAALAKFLSKSKPAAIYSTNYKRTQQTVATLARKKRMTVLTYDPRDAKAMAAGVLSTYPSTEIVVVGHSNTVLELVEAFGGKRPLDELTDEDYDYLFKVTIPSSGEIKTEAFQYGARHREP